MFCTLCGAGLPEDAQFCIRCGQPLRTSTVVRGRRRAGRVALVFALVAVAGVTGILLWRAAGPAPSPAPLPALTLAPSIAAEAVESARALAGASPDEFDISPEGIIVVRVGEALYDLTSGEALVAPPSYATSFAFVEGSLVLADRARRLSYLTKDRTEGGVDLPVAPARLRPTQDGRRLLVFGPAREPRLGLGHLLCALPSDRASGLDLLAASQEPILAATGDGLSTYFSVGGSLFRLDAPGRPILVLDLPDPAERIVGLAVAGETVYYSTDRAVVALRGCVTAPIVTGVGGQLRLTRQGLYLLDVRTRRLVRLRV